MSSLLLSSSSILTPNKHKIDNKKLNKWLNECDDKIRNIAKEFIKNTTYISFKTFIKEIRKNLKKLLSLPIIKQKKHLQFYLGEIEEIKYKSNNWIIEIIKKILILEGKEDYIISKITDKKDIDYSNYVIIADDASYSGSQIANMIEDNFSKLRENIELYIFIPFISLQAITTIINAFKETMSYNEKRFNEKTNEYDEISKIRGNIYINKNVYIMKPINELMSSSKIKELFSYYTLKGENIKEYPIYFDHKVADNYSSFPLIYSYGIIPNTHNKTIIHYCKLHNIPLKKRFNELERNVFLLNSSNKMTELYDISAPPVPLQPYKPNFIKINQN